MLTIPHKTVRKSCVTLALAALAVHPLAHADYPTLIRSDNPKAYYRLNDSTVRNLINVNSGSLSAAGNATNDLATVTLGVVHPMPGAIVGDADRAEFFDYTTRTEIPFNAALNTPNTQPFTVEAWFCQVSVGMGALANRWTQGGNRQGWVMYQRAPDENHCTSCGPGIGWEFRMYNDLDGNGHLDVTSGVPFQLGKWQHVAIVYDPAGNPLNATLTIYIDGQPANTNVADGLVPGYGPCTGNHNPAPNGQPAMALGGYNNANSGTYGFANPWIGGIDEYACYPAKLTAAQILAHYQNGTNANRTQSYSSLIQSHNPAAYLRLNEIAPGPDVAVNLGDLRSSGTATNTSDVRHPAFGALAGRSDDGAASYHWRNGSATTDIPWLASNNPDSGVPFTFEAWLRPTSDRQNPGAASVNNRYVSSGHRTGWVIFQRAPNNTYSGVSGYSGVGWNFRMYDGVTGSGQDVTTSVDYDMDTWQHLVVTWEPQVDNGDPGLNGNHQYQGILTAYFNGVVATANPTALYAANKSPTEDATVPSDLAVGSYNVASGLGANAFEGDVDEVAFYNGYVMTADQVLAHFMAGTNSAYGTNYETLVFNTASELTGPGIIEHITLPVTYLHFSDPAHYGAANSGSVGSAANGNLVLTTNISAGPQSPTYPGFDAANVALPLDGAKQWASFNNPAGLNIAGNISLEAWIKPGATQGAAARVISHGPQTISSYLGLGLDGAPTNTSEVFLRIDGGTNYSVGSARYDDGTVTTNTYAATAAVPGGDLGSSAWIHLVGTYDGVNWKLYRNGVVLATQASATGALAVDTGDWAIGSTGNGWADAFKGNVDEVAIYGYALSASQVLAHYKAGTAAPVLTITHSGATVTITWPYGTLYQADNITGPWTPVPGNPSSPYVTAAAGARKFYRF
jgi:hypothetical protein